MCTTYIEVIGPVIYVRRTDDIALSFPDSAILDENGDEGQQRCVCGDEDR
jgi:hypothetical protein